MPYFDVFYVRSERGLLISVMVIMFDRDSKTVVYLHGNGGHKMEALQLGCGKVNIVAFDFCGCGKSQGEYVTYGENEARDVAAVVGEVRRKFNVGKVVVWGRSMGASIGIMYASLYPKDVSSLILDTPFRWLKEVVRNIGEHNNSMPNFLISIGMSMV